MEYNFREIEKKWQEYWSRNKTFKAENKSDKPKYYVLDMFPYPSGAGLHVGHPLGYIASDIYARYKRNKGFNVLHPMGYDAFGLPAEQYAIQTGQHPAVTTEKNIERYREQLDKIGFSFDWDREVRTSDPDYYKWTQWIFIQLFNSWYNPRTNKAEKIDTLISLFEIEGFKGNGHDILTGDIEHSLEPFAPGAWKDFDEKKQSEVLMNFRLAYLGEAYVNWCPALGTVLANDEVKDGVSERGGHTVERKLMKQWSMRITTYAERLLQDLEELDWTESIKEQQRNWIGKSEGCSIKFRLTLALSQGEGDYIEVFTTRPDTIFGVSFVTLAPEHELVSKITADEFKAAVETYVEVAKNRSERERMADVKNVSGQFTGAYVEHPFTGNPIPVYIGDYVLAGYGTGAVMAVPGHDSRDHRFAKHFGLPIKKVIEGPEVEDEANEEKSGKCINSDFLNGLEVKNAIKKAVEEIEKKEIGKGRINYRLRDAVFGRQRYWGEPIPVYYKNNTPCVLSENELPLELPKIDKFLPTESGEPPLARAENWRYKPLSNSPRGGENRENAKWRTAANSSWTVMKERAREMRNNQTDAENVLWQFLKGNQLGYKFRRQHVIGNNVADFICLEKSLIIEVDGKIHETQKEYDEARTDELKIKGYEVIRFTNEEIFSNIDTVISSIQNKLEEKVLPNGEDLGGAYELTTMPGWAGSSWYFLRYMDAKNDKFFAGSDAVNYWQDVDLYIGGSEHATGHLLYARFWNKFLFDMGLIPKKEPFKKLINQGMIQGRSSLVYRIKDTNTFVSYNLIKGHDVTPLHVDVNTVELDLLDIDAFKKWRNEFENAEFILEDGKYVCGYEIEKMSKRWHNVVNPEDICLRYGADTLRLYEMFLGPLEQSKPWNTNGIEGVHRFLKKLWRLFFDASGNLNVSEEEATKVELKALHKTIKKVQEDIERFSFNTSVSNFMICVNDLTDLKCNKKAILSELTILLSPYAPHITEELWSILGNTESISTAPFPQFNDAYLVEDSFSYPVSFNGKTRFMLELNVNLSKEEIEKEVLNSEDAKKWLAGSSPKKVIVVPKKIVNIVV